MGAVSRRVLREPPHGWANVRQEQADTVNACPSACPETEGK